MLFRSMYKNGQLVGVLDLDSALVDDYGQLEQTFLERFTEILIDKTNWQFNQFTLKNEAVK